MGVFLDKLETRIDGLRAEVVRIRTDAVKNEEAAAAHLAVLQGAADTLKAQPKLEPLLMNVLSVLGIKLEA